MFLPKFNGILFSHRIQFRLKTHVCNTKCCKLKSFINDTCLSVIWWDSFIWKCNLNIEKKNILVPTLFWFIYIALNSAQTQHLHSHIVNTTAFFSFNYLFLQLPFTPSALYLALGLLVRWAGRKPTIFQPLTCFSFTISRVAMPWPLHSCFTSCSLTLWALLLEFMRLWQVCTCFQ